MSPFTESSAPALDPAPIPARTRTLQRLRAEKFARYSLLSIVILTGAVFFNMVKAFFVPVILAAVFAGLFHPFYERLLKLAHGRRAIAAFICCLALSAGVLLPAYGVAHLVAREAMRFYQTVQAKGLRSLEADLHSFVQRHPALQALRLETLPLQATAEQVLKKAADIFALVVNRASRETFELVAGFFLTFFTMFYFFRDGPTLVQRLKYFSPLADRDEDELIRRFLAVSRATLKGTLLVAVIKGTLGGLTFWAFGLDAPVLWGVVMMFLSVLPVVGAWLVMYPAAAMLVLGGQVWAGLGVFLIAAVIVGSIDNVLQPILVGRDSGMHELLVFFSMLGGIGIFGLMGFLVGPAIAALFRTLLDIYGTEFNQQLDLVHHAAGGQKAEADLQHSKAP
jgi:predicted PurR-regulated permease PerM